MRAKAKRKGVLDVGLVVLFGLLLTWIAARVYPVWDDGWMELFLLENTDLRPFTLDRPIVYGFLQKLIDWNVLFPAGIVIHTSAWIGIGLVTMAIWEKTFPRLASYRSVAALIAMAPMMCTIQLHLINNTMTGQIGTLLVYLSLLVLLQAREAPGRTNFMVRCLVSTALLVVATVLTDYAVPTGLACAALLLFLPDRKATKLRHRFLTVGIYVGVLLFGYICYWAITMEGGRDEVRPELALSSQGLFYSAAVTLLRLLSGLWQGSVGFLLTEFGQVEVHQSTAQAMLLVPCIIGGLGLFSLVRYLGGKKTPIETLKPEGFAALVCALTLGMMPIVFMRNVSPPNRFWLPLLPVASCLSFALLLTVVRSRYHSLVVFGIGFLATHAVGMLLLESDQSHWLARRWGNELKPFVELNKMTLAVFLVDERANHAPEEPGYHTRLTHTSDDYWLTAVMTRNWEVERTRGFWAFNSWKQAASFTRDLHWRAHNKTPEINRHIRGLKRKGALDRILWIHVDPEGSLEIIPEDVGDQTSKLDAPL